MSNAVIEVKQLPVIEEQLQAVKAEIAERVSYAKSLVCTEDTVSEIKKLRAELKKEFLALEERRKEVKNAVMMPYNRFEAVFRECVADPYKEADADLKEKIDAVEDTLRERRRAEVKEYFDEYLASRNVDFVSFEQANINVTLSASLKSLKEQARAFVDRICDDLNLIDTQEHKDEIMYEYQRSLNASAAILTVNNRYKAIEEAKQREAERKAREQAASEAAEKVEAVVETLAAPTVGFIASPVEEEPILTVKFTVRGTKAQLRALKEFLNNNKYDFE